MTTHLQNFNSTTQWVANASGDTYVLAEGFYLAVDGTAVSAAAAVTNRKFYIDGHVIGESAGNGMLIGQDAGNGGMTTIRIGESGSVLGEAFGVVAHGGGLDLINRGDITGGSDGLYMTGTKNAAVNFGSISSYDATGIYSAGDLAMIENHGSVTGEDSAVKLLGSASRLVNTGDISSSGADFSTTGVDMEGGNTVLVNMGTISTTGGRVVLGSDQSQHVDNHGVIDGYVGLGGGSDTFENIGGTVHGIVDLGDGFDTFISKDGYVSGSITGGDGNDDYYMYDTATVISEAQNNGFDTVHAFVSYKLADNFEELQLMGTADINGKGNDLDNYLVGNSGDNRLFGEGGADTFVFSGGKDVFNGGAGKDMVDFSNNDLAALTVNLKTGKGGGAASGISFVSVEDAIGSTHNDHLVGNGVANFLSGYTGKDVLTGGGGKDHFEFVDADGADTITDFTHHSDKIDLNYHINGVDIVNFSQVHALMHQKGDNVVIDFSSIFAGDKLVIEHAHVGDFSGADFIFH